jgi:hypothetical protein
VVDVGQRHATCRAVRGCSSVRVGPRLRVVSAGIAGLADGHGHRMAILPAAIGFVYTRFIKKSGRVEICL